jgi:hypothetical protein
LKIFRKVLVLGAVLLVCYASGFLVRNYFGISVLVKNSTSDEVHDLKIIVEPRGETYTIGLPSGARRRVWIKPVGESSVSLRFTDSTNLQQSKVIAGYVEGGYCGNIKVEITLREVLSADNVDVAFCTSSWEDFL